MDINKSSGLIFHPTSLPSRYGIGDLGKESYEFVDLLSQSKTSIWQVLPLGITDDIEFSPYSSKSSILGNPYLVSLDNIKNKIFTSEELSEIAYPITNEVNFKVVYENKNSIFKNISNRINTEDKEYKNYLNNEHIKKHLTFLTLSEINEGPWNNWNDRYQDYSEELFDEVYNRYLNIFSKNLFLQFEFNKQWQKLKSYANNNNVSILGDIPIYVNHNSADVWLNQNLFDLDKNKNMGFVSGAVPDDFTLEGQVWNTALYEWDNHQKEDYKYWVDKLNYNLDNYDYLRIDHFVGFFQFWAIPFGKPALDGHWRKGPWETFFEKIAKYVNFDKLLAEDLGVELNDTTEILTKYTIPGMKVLQQRIPNKEDNDEIHPDLWDENVVAYTGTHDSPTIRQWFNESKEQVKYFNKYKTNLMTEYDSNVWNFISMTWQSPCKLAVTTIQDLLDLGVEGRFNVPGTQKGNWKWRIEDLKNLIAPLEKLKNLNVSCGRIST